MKSTGDELRRGTITSDQGEGSTQPHGEDDVQRNFCQLG